MITKLLGVRIKDLRSETGLSQEAFANRIDMARTYFAEVETGKRNISMRNLVKIANGLGVSLSELFNSNLFDPVYHDDDLAALPQTARRAERSSQASAAGDSLETAGERTDLAAVATNLPSWASVATSGAGPAAGGAVGAAGAGPGVAGAMPGVAGAGALGAGERRIHDTLRTPPRPFRGVRAGVMRNSEFISGLFRGAWRSFRLAGRGVMGSQEREVA